MRDLVSLFISEKKPKKWLFILGCYNSGTTLLQKTLALHPSISTLPREGVRFTSVLPQPEDLGWTRMWIQCPDYMKFGNDVNLRLKNRVIRDWSPWFSEEAEIFLEKSITNLTRIDWIANNFENCYFIGMTRNGYCVSEGIRRKASPRGSALDVMKSDRYPIDLCAKQWVEANALLHSSSTKQKKILYIKYEDFVHRPDLVLTEIFAYLGLKQPSLKYENDILFFNNFQQSISNMNKKSISALSASDIAKVSSVIEDMQCSLGYELISKKGDL